MNLEVLKYPIGRFQLPELVTAETVDQAILAIKRLPENLKEVLCNLSDEMLERKYRPGGWTIRQVVHHLADSHMNAYMRFKLALTEENPVIKPYKENLWADLADSKLGLDGSVNILTGVHERWGYLMLNMTEGQWNRRFFHPERDKSISLQSNALLYHWHGNHHLAHIHQAITLEN
ncbi:YfiT family bacillithiol transferase [Cyclobacterium jeungdonense]|uniref:Metal-dependent hydrolase n=1 Tax=Cyclobacterium jeungdonense TaxID=708087 RepID=A0ABT8CB78_9BACT|nr:putative metal-dependent hydrolase [Cyclobacterium jeungdonense]MDN3690055.1 putative metal-dependent hydrolase [Cyclobacterium jeungdonense]